ncbi:MAG: hypothetical protein KAJ23_16425, partial [Maribacter sp.]|nr:hypothetical protein [Maribacter sp.]
MKNTKILLGKIWVLGLLCAVLHIGFIHATVAQTKAHTIDDSRIDMPKIVLNSNSFNAKKRSDFTIAGQTEYIERGLTIIHFNTAKKFEYATFDTYLSEEASAKMVEILWRMQKNNAVFAILAHDSAASSLLKQSEKLAKMGFSQLSTLKGRQAYIMYNFDGNTHEDINDTSTSIALRIPTNVSDNQIYFPKVRYEFEPHSNRYIAHAGGEVNGIKSTNSKDAMDQNYKKGFRLFELDIIETSDGKLVAAHDWDMWARFTDYDGALPPSHSEFIKHKIYGDYTTLDL